MPLHLEIVGLIKETDRLEWLDAKNKLLSCSESYMDFSIWEIAKKWKISSNNVYYSLQRTGTQVSKRKSNQSPQFEKQRHNRSSAVKRQLQDARLLGRTAKEEPYFRLATKEHQHWKCLETLEKVLRTDKPRFEVFGLHRPFVRYRKNEKMLDTFVG